MLKQILLLVLAISLVQAVSIDLQIQNQSCPSNLSFIQVLYNLPNCIVESFFNSLISGFAYSAKQFLESALNLIISTPPLSNFCPVYSRVMGLLESLYTIALMGVGAYYIASSNDPEKRANAKLWLEKVFFMIILLGFSFDIFKMILEFNQYITNSFYDQTFVNLFNIQTSFSSLIFAFAISSQFIFSATLTFFTLLVRYLMIPFLFLLFPIAIFLYFLPFTKYWGSFLLKFILLIVFMTSIDSVLILGMSYLLRVNDPNISGGFIYAVTIMLGFGLIGIVNSIIYLIAILSLIFAGIKVFESVISIAWKIAMLAAML